MDGRGWYCGGSESLLEVCLKNSKFPPFQAAARARASTTATAAPMPMPAPVDTSGAVSAAAALPPGALGAGGKREGDGEIEGEGVEDTVIGEEGVGEVVMDDVCECEEEREGVIVTDGVGDGLEEGTSEHWLAPGPLTVPGGQGVHSRAPPGRGAYVSAGQGGQEAELFDGAAVPGGHKVHCGAPPLENEPSSQLSQALLEPLPVLGLKVPGLQLVHAVLEEPPALGL